MFYEIAMGDFKAWYDKENDSWLLSSSRSTFQIVLKGIEISALWHYQANPETGNPKLYFEH